MPHRNVSKSKAAETQVRLDILRKGGIIGVLRVEEERFEVPITVRKPGSRRNGAEPAKWMDWTRIQILRETAKLRGDQVW